MFRREPENHDSAPPEKSAPTIVERVDRPSGQEFTPRSVSYVGPTVFFKGEISANEGLIIEGEIEGTIRHDNKNLTVGKQGRVRAAIHAKTIEVRGRIDGEIYGEEIVHLYSTAVVTGTIHCKRIIMDDGAEFNGKIDMSGEVAKPRKTKLKIAENDEKIAKVAG